MMSCHFTEAQAPYIDRAAAKRGVPRAQFLRAVILAAVELELGEKPPAGTSRAELERRLAELEGR